MRTVVQQSSVAEQSRAEHMTELAATWLCEQERAPVPVRESHTGELSYFLLCSGSNNKLIMSGLGAEWFEWMFHILSPLILIYIRLLHCVCPPQDSPNWPGRLYQTTVERVIEAKRVIIMCVCVWQIESNSADPVSHTT